MKRLKSLRRPSRECSKWFKEAQNFRAAMSNVVGGHLLGLVSVDDHSKNGRWAALPGDNRRNGKMESEFTKVIDDLDRAMNHTALSVTRRNGKHSSFQSGNSSFSVVFV